MDKQRLITELQSQGLRIVDPTLGTPGRRGGAGPSDHKAISLDGTTIMVPIYSDNAQRSPYTVQIKENQAILERDQEVIAQVEFPHQPRFYQLSTADGIPYWKIALLHSQDVLATTVLQTCIRYLEPTTACQFCAIEKSLAASSTIARKTPAQLAEVAEAAVRLDGVKHIVMTTGTPNTSDRGASYLRECAETIRARVNIPIQAQCEPPDDFIWFERLAASGVDSLGMHLEAADPLVRAQIMPGKATVSVDYYYRAFGAAVKVFGWGQVSTYLLAGLGDNLETLVTTAEKLIDLGVYPFIVPFVPISDTPLANHPAPDSGFMFSVYQEVGQLLKKAGMSSAAIKAGCAKCGACSALSSFEA